MKFTLAFTLTCLSLVSLSQDLKPYFTAIIVSDIEVSKEWYEDNLGFEIINETNMYQERGFKQANLSNELAALEIIQLRDAKNSQEVLGSNQRLIGLFKIGFKVSDFDTLVKKLQDNKVEFHGRIVNDSDGKKMLIIKDPDGNKIQFFEE